MSNDVLCEDCLEVDVKRRATWVFQGKFSTTVFFFCDHHAKEYALDVESSLWHRLSPV